MEQPMEPPTTAQVQTRLPTVIAQALSYILGKDARETSHFEILVVASGILFLAGQVCLLAWMLCRKDTAPAGDAPQPQGREKRKVAIVLPVGSTASLLDDVAVLTSSGSNGNGEPTLRFRLRRRSSWGGHPVKTDAHNDQSRRKSAGPLGKVQDGDEDDSEQAEKAIAQTSLSNPGRGPDLEQETSHDAPTAPGEVGSLGPEPATPTMLPLSNTEAGGNNGTGGEREEVTELRALGAPREWGEPDRLAAEASSIVKPLSPRSPRLLAADQAAMVDALLHAQEDQDVDWKADASSPVVGAEVDVPALAFGFEDPLGVNRLVGLSEEDEEVHEAVELEARDGKPRDV